jgi:hypothetical protein
LKAAGRKDDQVRPSALRQEEKETFFALGEVIKEDEEGKPSAKKRKQDRVPPEPV